MKINTQKIELLAAKRGMTVTELAQAMEMTNQNFNTIRLSVEHQDVFAMEHLQKREAEHRLD